jgi:predicted HTH transcriptional regulator
MYPSQDVASSIGNLIALPLQGQALRYGNIHMGAEFSGLSRQDVYEIPVESIRELLLNAAIHRSYLEHSNIQVAIYDDRLEVTSPGKLPLGQNIKRMKEGYSIIRNEAIAYAFSYMKLMEHWGSGIPRIIDRVMAAGLREPEFIDGDVDLRINIYRKQNDTNGDNVTKDVTKDVTIETNEAKVIDLIISNPTITQTKLAEELDVTTRTVKRILSKLQADGIVLREESNRNGKWIIKRKA